ncbi:hypothetical protein jhhlp_001531 [Lomentospora prolificans]|uniref:Uncharacterized protein n=1 Tax=Lomentospora prolificans TaxID=41688 RepID=A0A2N3NIQ1_9PEZI|nr:hypothetical protein jhhlp_001531 [Lomentospora prolificans]
MASQPSKPRRPTLHINTTQVPHSKISSSRKIVVVNPKDPTAFNTLSNVYATVIDRSTPVQAEPVTAIKTRQTLQIQTTGLGGDDQSKRTVTPFIPRGPTYPETPLSAHPKSPMNNPEFVYPSIMTSTPPLSAGPVESTTPSFPFAPSDMVKKLSVNTEASTPVLTAVPITPRQGRSGPFFKTNLPYTHPRALHSILRNSPLPPSSARVPPSPRRQSLRLQERAAKRVGYNSPLEQTIVNSKYVFSHVDLLAEDASPSPMSPALPQVLPTVEVEMPCDDETRDGGMTPGPMEDMRRKMAGLGTSSPLTATAGVRKRKKKEKKRQWAWTINQEDDPDEEVGGAIAALRAAEAAAKAKEAVAAAPINTDGLVLQPTVYVPPPVYVSDSTPSLCSQDSGTESQDVDMSDSSSFLSPNSSRGVTPHEMELDEMTPLVRFSQSGFLRTRAASLARSETSEAEDRTGTRNDTPIPPELVTT